MDEVLAFGKREVVEIFLEQGPEIGVENNFHCEEKRRWFTLRRTIDVFDVHPD